MAFFEWGSALDVGVNAMNESIKFLFSIHKYGIFAKQSGVV